MRRLIRVIAPASPSAEAPSAAAAPSQPFHAPSSPSSGRSSRDESTGRGVTTNSGSADRPAGSVRDSFLVVGDVRAARDYLVGQGVDVGEVQVFDSGEYRPARQGESLDMVGCAFFNDPDGNSWCVQQIPRN